MYGMTIEQENRFFRYCDHLRSLGFCVLSEPLPNEIEGWLAGIERNIARIEERLASTNRAFRCRGRSEAALYYLTSDRFDPGFGIHLTYDQSKANDAYRAKLERSVGQRLTYKD